MESPQAAGESREPETPPCGICGATAESGRATPLCRACRAQLAGRPLPRWIKVAAALILVPVLVELARVPAVLTAGVAFKRGERAEAAGDFRLAFREYSTAVRAVPNATLPLARQGLAAYHAGDFAAAEQAFERIGGRGSSDEVVLEVNNAIVEMNRLRR